MRQIKLKPKIKNQSQDQENKITKSSRGVMSTNTHLMKTEDKPGNHWPIAKGRRLTQKVIIL